MLMAVSRSCVWEAYFERVNESPGSLHLLASRLGCAGVGLILISGPLS